MVVFWIIASALIAAALFIVLPPLLGRRAESAGPTRDELNRILYRQRLAELQRDVDNDVLSKAQYERARLDLERELLSESADNDGSTEGASYPHTRWAGWIVGILLPALAVGAYLQFSTGLRTLSSEPGAIATATREQRGPSMEEMVGLIEARLRANPEDRTGWVMLARADTLLGRYIQASRAYGRADKLATLEDPELLVAYAQSLAIAHGHRFEGRPTRLLNKALKLDPKNPYALWLAGFVASQHQDFSRAVQLWERIEKAAPAGSPTANSELFRDLPERIAAAKRQAAAQALAASGGRRSDMPNVSVEEVLGANAEAFDKPGGGAAAVATLHVAVQLAPNFANRVRPGDTVFVYAQALNGARMPLALARATAAQLPLEVTLDDSMAMAPALNLSSVAQVRVNARISRTGEAMPSSGDLFGESAPVSTGSKAPVSITIDRAVP